ncbi:MULTISPECIES: hypothetical protein [unclassified Clostridium]|uniref:hypothetical protein n=1 Tax=unclassified Clostridium TaxID=2614128 RepID=UPI00338EA712
MYILFRGRNKKYIEDHFDKSVELEMELKKNNNKLLDLVKDLSGGVDINYIRQKETKGLGYAISCTKIFVGYKTFAILIGDDIVYNEGTPLV